MQEILKVMTEINEAETKVQKKKKKRRINQIVGQGKTTKLDEHCL